MTKIVIGAALSMGLLAAAACGGSSPASPSTSPSATALSATTFSAPAPSAGVPSFTSSSHEHESGDGDHGEGNGRELQLEGVIASIDATHKTFVVRGTTVKVLPETIIRHGHTTLTFADLMVGGRVHVKGAADGTAVAAREIKLQRGEGEDHDEGEAEGVVSGLAGTCPAITFNVGTLKVTTSATTVFRQGDCAAVVNGVNVEVKGTIQPDGSLLASRVSTGHEGDDEDD